MAHSLTLVALYFFSVAQTVLGSPCIAFDANWNLYALGLNGKDYNVATQDKWTGSNKANDITATGRPPFDGPNTTCYLSQFQNTLYVMNGDTQNPNSIYLYDAAASAWSQQTTTPGGFDIGSSTCVLDHDTNVCYCVVAGEMWFLNMQSLKAAQNSPIAWTDVGPTPYGPSYNQPVMALANNHIHFIDVPNVPSGSIDIFVIHYSYFQPQPQQYPLPSGTIPATHGQTASLFQQTEVQQQFAFIPDDGSATYVVDVIGNTTQKFAGPTLKDPKSIYFASMTALVQLTSNGAIYFLPYMQGNDAANAAASWTAVSAIAPATSNSTSLVNGTTALSSVSSAPTSGSSQGDSPTSGAISMHNISRGLSLAFALAAVICLL